VAAEQAAAEDCRLALCQVTASSWRRTQKNELLLRVTGTVVVTKGMNFLSIRELNAVGSVTKIKG
jgi:hypothetical protein